MWDDSYLFSKPIQIFDEQGKEKLNARIIWDENKLFIYGDVQDETRDPEDGVAIFIDPNNAKTPYLQEDDMWVIIRTDWTVETNKEGIDVQYFVSPGYKKYSFECSLTLPAVLERGQKLGFDMAVVDGGKMYSWSDTTNQQMSQTTNYGILPDFDSYKLKTLIYQGIRYSFFVYSTTVSLRINLGIFIPKALNI